MSFVTIPHRRGASKMRTSASHQEKKKRIRKKPEWNSNMNDLDAYKATPEEIERRKVIHQSQNADLVKSDKLRKRISKARSREKSPGTAAQKMRQLAILKEVLYDQSQLQDTLSKCDKAMAVVKDLFGDDPKRYRGLPNVTVAPNQPQLSLDNTLPNGTTINNPSKLDTLSESIMDKTALNEFEEGEFEDSDDSSNEELAYKPLLDLEQFRQFLVSEQERGSREEQNLQVTQSMAERALIEATKLAHRQPASVADGHDDFEGSFLGTSPNLSPVVTAINDTQKVNRTKAVFDHKSPPGENQSNDDHEATKDGSDLGNLRKVLDGLEESIAEYEHHTGRQPAAQRLVTNTFSGYTVALVDSVTKLTSYVKESEIRLRAESTLREQLAQDLTLMQGLLDALTSDLIGTQEDHMRIEIEFAQYRQQTTSEILALREALQQAGIKVAPPTPASVAVPVIPSGSHHYSKEDNSKPALGSGEPVLQSYGDGKNLPAQNSQNHHMNQTNLFPAQFSQVPNSNLAPAFQLSPPKQMDSPKPQGRKIQASRQQIQSVMQTLRQDPGLRLQGQQILLQQQQLPDEALGPLQLQQQAPPRLDRNPHHEGHSAFQTYVPSQTVGTVPAGNADFQQGTAGVTNVDLNMLQRQIEELNLQHAQAQSKLQGLKDMKISNQGPGSQCLPVSPSISPIPVASESQSEGTDPQQMYTNGQYMPASLKVSKVGSTQASAPAGRGITVSVPRVEHVEWSDNSPSPGNQSDRSASRRSSHSPVPMQGLTPGSRPHVPVTCGQ